MSIFKKVLSVGSGKLATELNTIVAAINSKEQEFEKSPAKLSEVNGIITPRAQKITAAKEFFALRS